MNKDLINDIKNQDYSTITETIEKLLSEQVKKNNTDGLVLGLSGGLDSAVLACVCKRLKDKTLALIMPDTAVTPKSETKDALKMISLTGIRHKIIDIDPIIRQYTNCLEPDERSTGNLRARVRTNILYYYANTENRLVLGSSDKSEYEIGYFTKYGDGASDLSPIISLYKLQVRELAKYLGVPEGIIAKKSSPHLWHGHQAEEELGVSYEEIDSVLYCLFEKHQTLDEIERTTKIGRTVIEKIHQLHINSEHKRLPACKPNGERHED